jgi:hypothetical protein
MVAVRWEDLTPKERKKYINQDYVPKYKLIPRNTVENIIVENMWGAINLNDSTKLKIAILGLSDDGKPIEEIEYHVPCSQQYISHIIAKYKCLDMLLKELKIRDKGYSRNFIQKNFHK